MNYSVFYFLLSFIVSILLGLFLIPILTRFKIGQQIFEIGPKWHKGKNGTPTMGGLIFILGICAVCLFCFKIFPNFSSNIQKDLLALKIVFFSSFGFAVIGFIDDFIKVKFKRNLGLTSWQKFCLQLLVAFFAVRLCYSRLLIDFSIKFPLLPFLSFITVGRPRLFSFLTLILMFIIVGCVNSVNLTDGIDGLATSVTFIISIFLFIVSKECNALGLEFLFSTLAGSLLGFLVFNKNPARVFMGDVGSLFLGGMVALACIVLGITGILPFIGFTYVIECLSVIIQVVSFKLTGKRVFKMSPIHHHLELSGMNENCVVLVFCLITFVMCVFSYFYLFVSF